MGARDENEHEQSEGEGEESETESEQGAESYGGDQDAGPAMDPKQANLEDQRDQAEGEDPGG